MNLILLFCLLSPWFGPTSAQEIKPHTVVTVPQRQSALLPCVLSSGQSIDKFEWKKDDGEEKKVFFYDRGSHYGTDLPGQSEQFKFRVDFLRREVRAGNASIIIYNTRLEDSGTYTCVVYEPHRQETKIRLIIDAAFVSVSEGHVAVLPCHLNIHPNVKDLKFSWNKDEKEVFLFDRGQVKEEEQFRGRMEHYENKIKYGIVSIKIYNTRLNDSGRYSCHYSNVRKSNVILQIIGKTSQSDSSGLYIAVAILTPITILLFYGAVLFFCHRLRKDQLRQSETPSSL